MQQATLNPSSNLMARSLQANLVPLVIKNEDFNIQFIPEAQMVIFQGELQLCGIKAYAPVTALLNNAIAQPTSLLCLDLRDLKFLNSSGIYMLLRFVLKVRNQRNIQLVVRGSEKVSWQSRSLPSLQQLMPQLDLQLEPAS